MTEPAQSGLPGERLEFFVHESARHAGRLLYEWLLEEARRIGLPGGSAFRAVAGFGRHGLLHEQHFFELAGTLTVKVEFLLGTAEAERLLTLVREAGAAVVYARHPVEFGLLGRDA